MRNGSTGRVLADRNARLYLSGVVVCGFGSAGLWLVAGVWVKSLTGSDSLAALTVFAMWAPVLAGPVLGALADRTRRRPLLVRVNLGMAALLPVLLLVDSGGRVWLVFAVLFVYGTAGAVQDAAEAALLPRAVGKELLGDLNGLRMTAGEGMKLIAPLTGAALFARFGAAPVVVLDAVTFALAAGVFALLRVREEEPPERTGGEGASGTWEGARYVWRSAALRPLVLAGAAAMGLAGLNGAVIHAVTDDVLGRPPAFTGVLYAAQGAGSVVGGVLAGPLLRRLGERRFMATGIALFAVAVGGRALPCDVTALVCGGLIGVGLPWVLVGVLTAVQHRTPDAVLGRTAATAQTLLFVPNALALALGAALVAVVDVRVLLPLLAAAGLVPAVALLRRPGGPARP
ncbi:MFS transporter [Streptomyces sp. WAC05374]|uniref:MFS transporter n=1 Tax=Streptomyces sp. WAC05374 TaxID=2487420 RepID=UPI000F85D870|nr:MFS transporter [Streptomyces sp. WAC05374]RST18720.1 MFS transporter [Streptomyces sp. WAC05374]TDF48325.1 MFS transporter [Streptomyces sp. WAC05374]TDF49222.1 MFS transporter [Streptomyces sp. WAC05374]TDF55258.1 MFS transporter [Streptomyces sp. WAC05374]